MVSFRSHLAARGLILASGFFLLTALRSSAQDTNAILDHWFAAQAGLHGMSADFVQTRTLKTLVQPLKAKGHLWFEPPGQFRWELGHPARTIALRHGDDMYVVYPFLKRAEHYSLGASAPREWRDAMALLEAGFPRTRHDFDIQFNIASVTQTNDVWVLELQPRAAAARQVMPGLRIFLSTKDYTLAGTQLSFMDGSTMRNDFSNIVINAPIDKKLFDWSPPANFIVTEPLAK